MIPEQLQAARAAHWRQNESPLLTLEDAQTWLTQHPLCLFLPRPAQLPAPSPSFVEACLGTRSATPGAAGIEQATDLLTRLVSSGSVVPLNLFGAVTEQPDFLAHTLALPSLLALRSDPDWKHAPQKSSGHKVSPLVLELWKLLETEGAMTAMAAREALGRELTEAAVLRALCELWQGMRISPVYASGGQPPLWEMMRVHHREALTAAAATGQVTSISLLVSMYLQSVYAASSEEIEVFLSPVASRSRVREAVRGLAATRQIHSLSMAAQTYHFLENGLPEFAEIPGTAAPEAPADAVAAPRRPRPVARKIQATAPPPGDAASAPIFRRPRPTTVFLPPPAEAHPEAAAQPRPERPSTPRFAAGPSARPAWKSAGRPPARPGTQFRTGTGRTDSKPPATGKRWTGTNRGAGPGGKSASEPGSRPPFRAARSFSATEKEGAESKRPPFARKPGRPEARNAGAASRPWAKPGSGRAGVGRAPDRPGQTGQRPPWKSDSDRGPRREPASGPRGTGSGTARPGTTRPDRARSGAKPAGAWAGSAKREAPKPWALPKRPSSTGSRPPRPGGQSSYRPPREQRPAAAGTASRPPVDRRGPGGRPPAGRPPAGFRPHPGRGAEGPGAEGRRPPARSGPPRKFDAPGRPSSFRPRPSAAGTQPGAGDSGARGARPPRSGPPRSGPPRSGPPRSGPPRSGPPRAGSFDRPRPGGSSKFGAKNRPESSAGGDGSRSERPTRPSFRKPGPSKFRPGGGGSAGKPGRPPTGPRKSDRKRPEA